MLCCMDAPIKTIQRNTYFTTYFNLHLNWWQLIQYSDDSAIVVLYLKAMTVNDNNCSTPTVECSQYIIRLLRLIRKIMKRNQGKGYDEVDHRNLHPPHVHAQFCIRWAIFFYLSSIQFEVHATHFEVLTSSNPTSSYPTSSYPTGSKS